MYTKNDLKSLVPATIFQRGKAYFEEGSVGKIRQQGDTYKAKVEGTETYRAELRLPAPGGRLTIYCSCPYNYGAVCKHGIALGLAVLELLEKSPVAHAAAAAPVVPLTGAARQQRVLQGAWANTSDKDKLNYLRQLLTQKPKRLRRFLAAFEFDEARLAGDTPPAAMPKPAAKPPAAQRGRKPMVRSAPHVVPPPPPVPRPPTLNEQAQQLLAERRGPELLPLLLTLDWLREPPAWDQVTLPRLLGQAARFQPEATLDAVMERFEGHLEKPELRAPPLFQRLAACLRAVAEVPALAPQACLFASELLCQYPRQLQLRQSLSLAGFTRLTPDPDEAPPRKRAPKPTAPKLAPDVAGLVPKRRGRPPTMR